ncbi:hypothetical protein G4B88_028815 [Cannabis sativa]|uniref:mRNA capping enzyme adenylation domain-containing protein n=1 Tax=Cannabis sativa TaxID=3483 RepID=A0A7J6FSN4_CANSA|nr:hypothetical protein G4B88_028815 [Cannabis sativa]
MGFDKKTPTDSIFFEFHGSLFFWLYTDVSTVPLFLPASKVIEKASRLRRSFNDDIFSGATINTDNFIADWNSSGFSVSSENHAMGDVACAEVDTFFMSRVIRDNIQLLRQRYYYATWKADGTRYMMLINIDGCYN